MLFLAYVILGEVLTIRNKVGTVLLLMGSIGAVVAVPRASDQTADLTETLSLFKQRPFLLYTFAKLGLMAICICGIFIFRPNALERKLMMQEMLIALNREKQIRGHKWKLKRPELWRSSSEQDYSTKGWIPESPPSGSSSTTSSSTTSSSSTSAFASYFSTKTMKARRDRTSQGEKINKEKNKDGFSRTKSSPLLSEILVYRESGLSSSNGTLSVSLGSTLSNKPGDFDEDRDNDNDDDEEKNKNKNNEEDGIDIGGIRSSSPSLPSKTSQSTTIQNLLNGTTTNENNYNHQNNHSNHGSRSSKMEEGNTVEPYYSDSNLSTPPTTTSASSMTKKKKKSKKKNRRTWK